MKGEPPEPGSVEIIFLIGAAEERVVTRGCSNWKLSYITSYKSAKIFMKVINENPVS